MSVWVKAWTYEQKLKSIFHPCQLEYSLTNFDGMSKYILTKVYSATSVIIHMSSLPCGFAIWTFDNNVFIQSNVSIKIYQSWCPICWREKKFLEHLLKILWICPLVLNMFYVLEYYLSTEAYFALPRHSW